MILLFSNFTCNFLYHKIERGGYFEVKCTEPNIKNGLIYLNYIVVFKPKVFNKMDSYSIKPILVTGDTTIHFNTHILQGENIDNSYPVVSWRNGGSFHFTDSTMLNNVNLNEYEILAQHIAIRGSVDESLGQINLSPYLMFSKISNN